MRVSRLRCTSLSRMNCVPRSACWGCTRRDRLWWSWVEPQDWRKPKWTASVQYSP